MNNQNEVLEKRLQKIEENNPQPKFKVFSVGEIISTDFGDVEWLIEKLIPLECTTILSGAPASYKTWLFMQMAIDIAQGSNFLGQFKTSQSAVLIINEEDHLRIINKRLELLKTASELPIYIISQGNFSVSDKNAVSEIIKICKEKNIKSVFIDSLVRINDADENASKEMSKVFKELKKFCQAGITVAITHHENKSNSPQSGMRLRGSSDILASLDSLLTIKKDPDDKYRLNFEQPKLRLEPEVDPFDIAIIDDGESIRFEYIGPSSSGSGNQKRDEIKKIILNILSENENGLTKKEITAKTLELIQAGMKVPGSVIDELIGSGEITWLPGKKNSKLCFLATQPKEDSLFE